MFLLIFVGVGNLYASNNKGLHPLIQNLDSRSTQLLDGQWKYMVDPYENGYYNYRKHRHPHNGYWMDQKNEAPGDDYEYNFDLEQSLKVPGDWNTQDDKLFWYEGNIWYRQKFNRKVDFNKRYFVYFGAVNYQTNVFLNTRELGMHEGGFTSFNFEITKQIKEGENTLMLKVDNRRFPEAVPTDNTDWFNYGGITRSVHVVEVPETFVRDYFIQLDPTNPSNISGWIQMDGSKSTQKVEIEIPELKLRHTVTTNEDGYAAFSFRARPVRWSPANPKLYDIQLKAETDVVKDQIGFRTIETKGKKILLNGEELFSRGISIHEEAPFRSGRAWSRADAQNLLGMAKELGCNFVRLAHYPHNETMVKEAERMGLLVWSEIPVYWTIHWNNEGTLQNARNQLEEMITRDKNRTNIIIWSISNETPVSEARNHFLKTLAEDTKRLDPTRLVAMAMEVHNLGDNVRTIDDPLANYLDVLSFNQYIGWYVGQPELIDRTNWSFKHDKPVFISEMGAGALQGYHADVNQRWSEEYQADLYERSIQMLKRMDGLAGVTPWVLMDFRSPRRPLPVIKDGFNRKGLYSDQAIPKKAFYVLQKWYKEIEAESKKKR